MSISKYKLQIEDIFEGYHKLVRIGERTFKFSLYTDGYVIQEMFCIVLPDQSYICEIRPNHFCLQDHMKVGRRTAKKMDLLISEAFDKLSKLVAF